MAEPVVVSIWKDKNRAAFLCSGLMLSGRHILTVKHAFDGWSNQQSVYVRLIDGVEGAVEAQLLGAHERYDVALLELRTSVRFASAPTLLTTNDRAPDGSQIGLQVIDPDNHSRAYPANYAIGNFDHDTGEYNITPQNALGHSGGVAVFEGVVIGVLSRRMKGDPLCRAVATHLFADWLRDRLGEDIAPLQQSGSMRQTEGGAARAQIGTVNDIRSPGSTLQLGQAEIRQIPQTVRDPAAGQRVISPGGGQTREFRIALSFAGAQRNFVEEVAESLADHHGHGRDKVYFYHWFAHRSRPGGLALGGPATYRDKSDLTVVFLSEHYNASDPCWSEWRAVLDMIQGREAQRVLLFNFDNTRVDGMRDIDPYVPIDQLSPGEVAVMIARRWEEDFGASQSVEPAVSPIEQLLGRKISALLQRPGTRELRDTGGFPHDPSLLGSLAARARFQPLVGSLYRATQACVSRWRQQPADARLRIQSDCYELLGELAKLAVDAVIAREDLAQVPQASEDSIFVASRHFGTAAAVYCTLRDLPLRLSERKGNDEDVGGGGALSLDGLAMGPGSDGQRDVLNAVWRHVHGNNPPQEYSDALIEKLQDVISMDQEVFDKPAPFIVLRGDREWLRASGYAEATAKLKIGLVIHNADSDCPYLAVTETRFVNLICKYGKLVEDTFT